MNPMEHLNDKDREIATKILTLMSKSKDPTAEELQYLINNASPTVEIMKKAISKRLVSLGVDSDESMAMVSVLTQLGIIAGGISFADFAVTEKMADNLEEQNWQGQSRGGIPSGAQSEKDNLPKGNAPQQ